MLRDLAVAACMIFVACIANAGAPDSVGVEAPGLPKGFVYVDEYVPHVYQELRYATAHNFVGKVVDGYHGKRAILTQPAAQALARLQEELQAYGLGLKIYDAYRPQQAVDHFVRWAADLSDTRMKAKFYPNVRKADLFAQEYIAARSSHSRGSTVDITLVNLADGKALDMGSGWDYFGEASRPSYQKLTAAQRANRMLLQLLMRRHGFKPYAKEWWHFTLESEPYPDRYFYFSVR